MKTKMLIPLILLMLALAIPTVVFADEVHVTFDIDNGSGSVLHFGKDATAWHPGAVGESNLFQFSGDVKGTYDGYEGIYGKLSTYVHASTDIGGGAFYAKDTQDFNVLSANHIYNTQSYLEAFASGPVAEMNMKFIGSMYVFSEATDPYWEPCLKGSYIEKHSSVSQGGVLQGDIDIGILTTGVATMSNSNIWGWGTSESGYTYTDYSGGTRTITATGSGTLWQNAYGKDSLEFNGFVAGGGGSATLILPFAGGITGPYSMHAK